MPVRTCIFIEKGVVENVGCDKKEYIMAHRIETPADLALHKQAFEFAKDLIRKGKVNCDANWKENEPRPAGEDEYLVQHGFKDYGKWFLATVEETSGDTKEHYEFPIGDFSQVFRSGVIAAKQRAGQFKHTQVEAAAAELLELIDKNVCNA